jgi:hypothetical protein
MRNFRSTSSLGFDRSSGGHFMCVPSKPAVDSCQRTTKVKYARRTIDIINCSVAMSQSYNQKDRLWRYLRNGSDNTES